MNNEKKTSSKKWFLSVLTIAGVTGAAIVLINCTVDAYGILRTDFSKQFQEPNKNFIKMKYLLKNPSKFDSFIFGSSRVNIIDGEKIRNGIYYNMTYSEGVPKDHLDNIRFMLRSGMKIKNIMIGLDDFSYLVDPQSHYYDLLRQPYPAVSGKTPAIVYSEYFVKLKRFVPQFRSYILYSYILKSDDPSRRFSFDIYTSGRTFCKTCDDDIEKDINKHARDPKFDKPDHYEGDNVAGTLESLRELTALARENHINLVLFINPIHRTTYLDTNLEQLFTFKRELAKIIDYYDFSGLNSVTTNNYYYYETSHYRSMVADMMLRKMFGSPGVAVPADFGVLVTKNNIDAHLRRLRRQLEELKSPLNGVNAAFAQTAADPR